MQKQKIKSKKHSKKHSKEEDGVALNAVIAGVGQEEEEEYFSDEQMETQAEVKRAQYEAESRRLLHKCELELSSKKQQLSIHHCEQLGRRRK